MAFHLLLRLLCFIFWYIMHHLKPFSFAGLGIFEQAADWCYIRQTWWRTILCSLPNWRTPSHYIFIQQQNNLFNSVHLCAHLTGMQIMRPVARRTFTLTPTGLFLRVNQCEARNFCQLGNEYSIVKYINILRVTKFSTCKKCKLSANCK